MKPKRPAGAGKLSAEEFFEQQHKPNLLATIKEDKHQLKTGGGLHALRNVVNGYIPWDLKDDEQKEKYLTYFLKFHKYMASTLDFIEELIKGMSYEDLKSNKVVESFKEMYEIDIDNLLECETETVNSLIIESKVKMDVVQPYENALLEILAKLNNID